MAVAFDAVGGLNTNTGTLSSYSWTHTPVGTPAGVLVGIVTQGASTDLVTGVTYGGVDMGRVITIADSAGEPGRTYLYFLGSSIPTGAQTVVVNLSAVENVFSAASTTITGAGDTYVQDSDSLNADTANPSVTLQYSGNTCITVGTLYYGGAAPGDAAINANMTEMRIFDAGAQAMRHDRQTTPGTSDFTFSYTAASDDCALCAAALTDVPPPSALLQDIIGCGGILAFPR